MTDVFLKYQPIGPLAEIIKSFICFKRSQGYKYLIEENTLYRFSVFSAKYTFSSKTIPENMLADWFKLKPFEKPATQRARCSCTHVFIRYAMDYGYKANLPEYSKARRNKYVPYIFTDEEIKTFFTACDSFEAYAGSHRHEIVPVIFRLLYGCGLRASEAASLKLEDVDLKHDIITIHGPKNGRDRYVPMSPSITEAMQWFHHRVHSVEMKEDSYFFSGKYNDHLTRHCVYKWFRICLRKAGISHQGRGKGPREHDLRHTFCVHSLRNLYQNGYDLYCVLPVLSVYVGHKSITVTQDYLRLTADMYPDICARIEKTLGQIIPNVNEDFDYAK